MVMVYVPANEDEDEFSCMAFGASGHMDCQQNNLGRACLSRVQSRKI